MKLASITNLNVEEALPPHTLSEVITNRGTCLQGSGLLRVTAQTFTLQVYKVRPAEENYWIAGMGAHPAHVFWKTCWKEGLQHKLTPGF